MIEVTHDWGSMYFGHSFDNPPQQWYEIESQFEWRFRDLTQLNRGFHAVWDAWLQKYHAAFPKMTATFDGHAAHVKGKWVMQVTQDQVKPVQDFVNEHDGQALVILLLCCNPRNRGRVTSKKSLVIYSRSSLSLGSMQSRRSKQIMHIPGHGDFVGTIDEDKMKNIAASLNILPMKRK